MISGSGKVVVHAKEQNAAAAGGIGQSERQRYAEATLRARTGRGWDQWFALLDAWVTPGHRHPQIARWLAAEHGVSQWWAQGITVAYEQERGRRVPGQRCDGSFAVAASSTVAVPVDRLFAAFADPQLRQRWLPDANLEARSGRPGKVWRAVWSDPSSRVEVQFAALGQVKSRVAVQHDRLPDAETADQIKAYWRTRLAVLEQLLEA